MYQGHAYTGQRVAALDIELMYSVHYDSPLRLRMISRREHSDGAVGLGVAVSIRFGRASSLCPSLSSGSSTIRYNLRNMASRAPGMLIREARHQAGLSQVELGRRAGVTQSVISAYESGARQPSLPMLERLVRATGCELDVAVHESQPSGNPPVGPVTRRLLQHRRKVRDVLARHGLTNARIFGSVVRGEDTADSDLDILVDVAPGVGLLGLARCERDLEALLEVPVDLVPAKDLKPGVALSALAEARPL